MRSEHAQLFLTRKTKKFDSLENERIRKKCFFSSMIWGLVRGQSCAEQGWHFKRTRQRVFGQELFKISTEISVDENISIISFYRIVLSQQMSTTLRSCGIKTKKMRQQNRNNLDSKLFCVNLRQLRLRGSF